MCVGGGGELGWQIIEWGGAERREACEIRRRGWCEVKIWCSEGLLASGATNSLRLQCAWRNSIYYLDIYGGFSSHGFTVCNGEFTPVCLNVCLCLSVWMCLGFFPHISTVDISSLKVHTLHNVKVTFTLLAAHPAQVSYDVVHFVLSTPTFCSLHPSLPYLEWVLLFYLLYVFSYIFVIKFTFNLTSKIRTFKSSERLSYWHVWNFTSCAFITSATTLRSLLQSVCFTPIHPQLTATTVYISTQLVWPPLWYTQSYCNPPGVSSHMQQWCHLVSWSWT